MVVAADHEIGHALKNLMLLVGELNLFFDAPTCHDIIARCNKRGDDGSRNRKPRHPTIVPLEVGDIFS